MKKKIKNKIIKISTNSKSQIYLSLDLKIYFGQK